MPEARSVVYQTDEPGKVRMLTAKEINGNAKENWIDFMAPVTY